MIGTGLEILLWSRTFWGNSWKTQRRPATFLMTWRDLRRDFNVFFKPRHFRETIYLNCGMRTKVRGLDASLSPVSSPLCGAAAGEKTTLTNSHYYADVFSWLWLLPSIPPRIQREFFFYRVPKIVVAVHKVGAGGGGGGNCRNLPNKIQEEESVSDLSVAFRRPGPAIASVDSDHFSPS